MTDPKQSDLLPSTNCKEALTGDGNRKKLTTFYRSVRQFLALTLATILLVGTQSLWHVPLTPWKIAVGSLKSACQQTKPIFPTVTNARIDDAVRSIDSDGFRNESIRRLSGAVQIPTMSFDDLGEIGRDRRWDVFYSFAEYLRKTFPLIHGALDLEVINEHGLLFTWVGSGSGQPTLLMAHQDVVPVPESTIPAWDHGAFTGHYDGEFIWGRGSSDCKNSLIGLMEAIELLLSAGYRPKRSVLISLGFDEEVSGQEGAGALSSHILKKYGRDSVAVIIDEGAGMTTKWGRSFAIPRVAEKGFINVDIIVRMPGGHSSIPPKHNGIGVMSQLITLIEDNPYEPHLDSKNPYLGLLQCGAAHGPEFPRKLKKLLPSAFDSHYRKARTTSDRLALEASKESLEVKYLMTTSAAVDIINGGVKVNALPERTAATVNHRINVGESSTTIKEKLTSLAKQIAARHNLTVHPFGEEEESPSSITLKVQRPEWPPAPVTPTSLDPFSAYTVLAGTTRALYGDELIVSPGEMTGNTDTRFYWDLTRNIFRFSPGWDPKHEGFGNIHTVNEKISVKAHIATIQWYTMFLRNMDEARLP